MAKKYENVEKVRELLDEKQLGQLQKRISSTEKSLSEILKKLSALEADKTEREAALAREEAFRSEAAEVSAPEYAEGGTPQTAPSAPETKAEETSEKQSLSPEKTESEQETSAKPAPRKGAAETATAPAAPAESKKEEKKEAPAPSREAQSKAESAPTPAEPVKKKPSAPAAETKPETTENKEPQKSAPSAAPAPAAAPVSSAPAATAQTRPAAPGAPRAPRYFRNGQEQGVYIAKPGVDVNAGTGSSYRPRTDRPARPQGDRPPRPMGDRPRPQGDRPYQGRQGATGAPRPRAGAGTAAAPIVPKEKTFTAPPKKKAFEKTYVEKKPVSKRTLIKQQGMTVEDFDESKSGYRKLRTPKKQKRQEIQTVKIDHAVVTTQEIPLKVLSEKLGISAVDISKRLFKEGIMKSINDSIDYDNAALIAADLGIDLEYKPEKTAEEVLHDVVVTEEDGAELVARAPVVTVMGHVDHGKTSLLDKIRSTSVTSGEAGGITQSIGAYTVTAKGRQITFIDTPGHAAFTAMRARGAQITDIVVLVVAADDGIMPQTVEAINHAKAAGISIIVAINKIDKPSANPEAIKQELTKYDLVPEEWGGDTICVPVSALTKKGIPELLEMILLVAEMKEFKANPDRRAKGIVIEAKLDRGRGPVATVLVQNGTLHAGDTVIVGTAVGRVRAMSDDKGKQIKAAGPSVPVEIIGLDSVPSAGDELCAVEDERMAKELAEQRRQKAKEEVFKANAKVNLDDLFAQMRDGVKDLNIIVKADVKGSAEAVKASLEKLSNEEVKVNVIHTGVGGIIEGDVMLASASNAIIVGFNVRPDKAALDSAALQGVDIRTYRIIYECIEEITAAIKGMLKPIYREVVLGHAEVRQTIHVPNVGMIAGSYVTDGKITRASLIRVIRDGVIIFEDKISSLRRFKDDVKEVASGYECGVGLEKFNDIKEKDVLEAYIMEQVER